MMDSQVVFFLPKLHTQKNYIFIIIIIKTYKPQTSEFKLFYCVLDNLTLFVKNTFYTKEKKKNHSYYQTNVSHYFPTQ